MIPDMCLCDLLLKLKGSQPSVDNLSYHVITFTVRKDIVFPQMSTTKLCC